MTIITFLGFLIDTIQQTVSIPTEKIAIATNMIDEVLDKASKCTSAKRKIMVHKLQQICGFLNFIGRAIIPGRAFTRRLYSHLQNNNLRPHHHIRITQEMLLDLSMWQKFVRHPSIYMLDHSWITPSPGRHQRSNFIWMHQEIFL